MEAKVAAYLHPVGPQRPPGSNEGAWHRGGPPPIGTQWHEAGSQLCASGGGSVEA